MGSTKEVIYIGDHESNKQMPFLPIYFRFLLVFGKIAIILINYSNVIENQLAVFCKKN